MLVFAPPEADYTTICERIRHNGEPGIAWLHNMGAYSRMCDPPVSISLHIVCLRLAIYTK